MGALTMGLGALASVAVSIFDTQSAIPMVAIMAGSSVIALGILLTGRKNITNYSTGEEKPVIIH
jgi:DHA1 family bicyclomycin/chloramphenicol resistance-like MFS transporter